MSETAAVGEEPSLFGVRCIFASPENKPRGPRDLKPGETDYEERVP